MAYGNVVICRDQGWKENVAYCSRAIDIAGSHRLRSSHAAGLAVCALTYVDRAAAGRRDNFLWWVRRDADVATTRLQLAWQELGAPEVHARIDEVGSVHNGWSRRPSTPRAPLIAADLDSVPLATVRRLTGQGHEYRTAAQRRSGRA